MEWLTVVPAAVVGGVIGIVLKTLVDWFTCASYDGTRAPSAEPIGGGVDYEP